MKNISTPSYIKWVFTDHYFKNKQGVLKFLATLLAIFMSIAVPGPVMEEYMGGWIPIWPVVGCFIATYGFLIGIILQPYMIYKRLKQLGWWKTIDNDLKN
jgi:hypothetical protein|tara:strand:+ start:1685 stop:1984 length:300 start_codon:yes stop_codon:yes gene_type:complete